MLWLQDPPQYDLIYNNGCAVFFLPRATSLHKDTVCCRVSAGALLVSTTTKECRDSDADLDVDGDDTLEYGRAQYPLQQAGRQHADF